MYVILTLDKGKLDSVFMFTEESEYQEKVDYLRHIGWQEHKEGGVDGITMFSNGSLKIWKQKWSPWEQELEERQERKDKEEGWLLPVLTTTNT